MRDWIGLGHLYVVESIGYSGICNGFILYLKLYQIKEKEKMSGFIYDEKDETVVNLPIKTNRLILDFFKSDMDKKEKKVQELDYDTTKIYKEMDEEIKKGEKGIFPVYVEKDMDFICYSDVALYKDGKIAHTANVMFFYGKDISIPFNYLFKKAGLLPEIEQIRFYGLALNMRHMSIKLAFFRKYLKPVNGLQSEFDQLLNVIEQGITLCDLVITTALLKDIALRQGKRLANPDRKEPDTDVMKQGMQIIVDTSIIRIKESMKKMESIDTNSCRKYFNIRPNVFHDVSRIVFIRMVSYFNDTWKVLKPSL